MAQARRRAALMAAMQPGAVAVLTSAPELVRNNDNDYPYRHDSALFYLTAFAEPDSALVLVAPGPAGPGQAILFCRAKNSARELWDGFRHGPDQARITFGVDAAFPIDELDEEMARLLADAPAIYYALGSSSALDGHVKTWLHRVRQRGRSGVRAPTVACDVLHLIDAMRVIKDDGEQDTLRRAAGIAALAHCRAMAATRPGMAEYAIEAELLYEFRRHGAQALAYTPIVAAGANTCVLHYSANNGPVRDGDLVLIDAGCELDGYASDISRTYPANGRFSAPQAALYELVLAAQMAALDAVQPGRPYGAIHSAAVAVLAQGMLDLGLLSRERHGSLEDVLADQSYLQFYMHGTGHWLGMDVHDVGSYRDSALPDKPWRALQAGMVLTVEPGIYVRPAAGVPEQYWQLGIRIEDDVLVTPDGHAILSDGVPKSRAAIERLMAGAP